MPANETTIKATIDSQLPDNTTRSIKALGLRGVLKSVVDWVKGAMTGLLSEYTPITVVLWIDNAQGNDANAGLDINAPLKTLTGAAAAINNNGYREVVLVFLNSGNIDATYFTGGEKRAKIHCEKLFLNFGVDGYVNFQTFTQVVDAVTMTGLYGIDTSATTVILAPTNYPGDSCDIVKLNALPAWNPAWTVLQKTFYHRHRAAINMSDAGVYSVLNTNNAVDNYERVMYNVHQARYFVAQTYVLELGANAALVNFLDIAYYSPELLMTCRNMFRAYAYVRRKPYVGLNNEMETNDVIAGANSRVALGATDFVHYVRGVNFSGVGGTQVSKKLFDLNTYDQFLLYGDGVYLVSVVVYKYDGSDYFFTSQYSHFYLVWRADMYTGEIDSETNLPNCLVHDNLGQYADPTGITDSRKSNITFSVRMRNTGVRMPEFWATAGASADEYIFEMNFKKVG